MIQELKSKIKTKEFWIKISSTLGLLLSAILIADYLLPVNEVEEIIAAKEFTRNYDAQLPKREGPTSFCFETENRTLQINSDLYHQIEKGNQIKIKFTPILRTVLELNFDNKTFDDFPSVYNYNLLLPISLLICSILSIGYFLRLTQGFFVGFTTVLFIYSLCIIILN